MKRNTLLVLFFAAIIFSSVLAKDEKKPVKEQKIERASEKDVQDEAAKSEKNDGVKYFSIDEN